MRRGVASFQGPGRLPVTPAVGLLLVLMGGLTAWVLSGVLQSEPLPKSLTLVVPKPAVTWAAPAEAERTARAETPAVPLSPMQLPMQSPTPTPAPAPALQIQPAHAALQQGPLPYRFIGHSASASSGMAVVLFGRGRVVMLQGPALLDDEYAVEALFDDYLVLYHLPSGRGHFLALSLQHTPVGTPQDPEQSARD